MTARASLEEFLRTGQLGPIHSGLNPNQVAEVLGTPESWISNGTLPFPDYWCYGNLEISFERRKTAGNEFGMNFFQIEHAGYLAGDYDVITNAREPILVVDLDGLTGKSRIPDILKSMAGCPEVKVLLRRFQDTVTVTLHNGAVDVVMAYDMDDDTREWTEAEMLALSDAEVISIAAVKAKLDSIYSFAPTDPRATVDDGYDRREFTAAEFLAAATK